MAVVADGSHIGCGCGELLIADGHTFVPNTKNVIAVGHPSRASICTDNQAFGGGEGRRDSLFIGERQFIGRCIVERKVRAALPNQ